MLSAKPNPGWENSDRNRYIPHKHQQPLAVYELSKRSSGTFFNYLGKFTLLCLFGGLVYLTVVWLIHGRTIMTSANTTEIAAEAVPETPVVAQTTPAQGPRLGYVASWGITTSAASISWSTNVPATTALAYGTERSLGQSVPLQTKLDVTHGVKLTGLKSGTTYYFVAQSNDKEGVAGYSSTGSFTTKSLAAGPVISKILVVPDKDNHVQISWVTSVPAYSYVQIGSTTSYNRYSTRTQLTTTAKPTLSWVPNGTVHYQLVSTDASGNKTESPDYTFVEP